MSKLVILENVADERGETAAKVARTLVRLGCDLYLRFGPSREPHTGENFFPTHPTVVMEHQIDPGDYPLTKDSQEVVIKRLDRVDFETKGLFILINAKIDSSKTATYQIELKGKNDESICVVVDPDDVAKLPPLSKYQTAPVSMYPAPPEKKILDNSEEVTTSGKQKPHTVYIVHEKKAGTKRGVAWMKLKGLASESKGEKQISLPGFGKIYLKRDREKPETYLRYKHIEFERPDDGNQITKKAFDRAWDKTK